METYGEVETRDEVVDSGSTNRVGVCDRQNNPHPGYCKYYSKHCTRVKEKDTSLGEDG